MWIKEPESALYLFHIQPNDKPAIEKCCKLIKDNTQIKDNLKEEQKVVMPKHKEEKVIQKKRANVNKKGGSGFPRTARETIIILIVIYTLNIRENYIQLMPKPIKTF